jgi:hypothetical protein
MLLAAGRAPRASARSRAWGTRTFLREGRGAGDEDARPGPKHPHPTVPRDFTYKAQARNFKTRRVRLRGPKVTRHQAPPSRS